MATQPCQATPIDRFRAAHPSLPLNIMRSLVSDAACLTGYPATMIRGPVRWRVLAQARFAVMRVAYSLGLSTTQIGLALNGRDHSTVLYGLSRAEELMSDPAFAAMVGELER